MRRLFAALLCMLACPLAMSAQAATPGVPDWLSEARVGLLTHNSHMVTHENPFQPWRQDVETGLDLNFELLFNGPSFLQTIGSPRLQLGGDVSLKGETNHIYAGLDWQHDFASGLFIGGFFGLAVHDGEVNIDRPTGTVSQAQADHYNDTKQFGSRFMFHLGPEVGYRFDEHNALMLSWLHFSNGWILNGGPNNPNPGQDNVGLRYGYRF